MQLKEVTCVFEQLARQGASLPCAWVPPELAHKKRFPGIFQTLADFIFAGRDAAAGIQLVQNHLQAFQIVVPVLAELERKEDLHVVCISQMDAMEMP
eukprot:1541006-Rhodomonas_salina.3